MTLINKYLKIGAVEYAKSRLYQYLLSDKIQTSGVCVGGKKGGISNGDGGDDGGDGDDFGRDVVVVTPEWVLQCILHNKLLDPLSW